MELTFVDDHGAAWMEGVPDETFLASAQAIDRLIEACFSAGARAALLYAANLPPGFFDLSSGDAGVVLQKLRTYRLKLAVVYTPGRVTFSSRFSELMVDEQRGSDFGLFEHRQAAREWLRQR